MSDSAEKAKVTSNGGAAHGTVGNAAPIDAGGAPGEQRRSFLSTLRDYVQQMGRDVASVTLGKFLGGPDEPDDAQPADERERVTAAPADETANMRRLNVLHRVTEQLRGAADQYIAAKLDEIEARVDAKLDHVENRIDQKILRLQEQLKDLRDQELKHRLQILKITLIFTVLVAVISLGYKLVLRYFGG